MLYIYVDIDGTMTETPHAPNGTPRADVIKAVKLLPSLGYKLIVWSARGEDYVRNFVKQHDIPAYVTIGKPDICIDDKAPIIRPNSKLPIITPEDFVKRIRKNLNMLKAEDSEENING